MPRLPLDDFVEGLQMSVAQARANLAEADRGRLERLIELASDGRTQAVTWSFVIDGEQAAEGDARMVRLPLISLRRHLISQIAEVQVELRAAAVEAPTVMLKRPRQRRLQLVVDSRAASLRKRLHRLTVRIKGHGKADVSIDDCSGKTVDLQCEGAAATEWSGGKR